MRYIPVFLTLLGLSGLPASAQMSVSLVPSVPSPAALGTVVVWTASVSNGPAGTFWYRFRTGKASVRPIAPPPLPGGYRTDAAPNSTTLANASLTTTVDYGPNPTFTWSTMNQEGDYEVQVTAQNQDTGDEASAWAVFELDPLASSDASTITATTHPLVFIYSAPPCPAGSRMKVQFQSPGDRLLQTPYQACDGQHTMNFYIAGLRAGAVYSAWQIVQTGQVSTTGAPLTFGTATVLLDFSSVPLTPEPLPTADGILLQSTLQLPAVATDLAGEPDLVWPSRHFLRHQARNRWDIPRALRRRNTRSLLSVFLRIRFRRQHCGRDKCSARQPATRRHGVPPDQLVSS